MSSKLQKQAAWESGIPAFFYKQLLVHAKPIPASTSLGNQTAIITGANGGLGFEAGRQLLQLGLSRLIMAVRSQSKGETAASKLRKEFPKAQIEVSILDLADYHSVIAFAEGCKNLSRIDIVILNAGMQSEKFVSNPKTGHEEVFQANYLSTVLLTILLVPILKEKGRSEETGRPPVLSVVGSDTMYLAKMNKPAGGQSITSRFDDPAQYKLLTQYPNSKLVLMMFISKLAELVSPNDVLINVCNPGLTGGTSLAANHSGFLARYIAPLLVKALGRSVRVGASVYVDAVVVEGKESHGSFVSEWTIKPYAKIMYTEEGREMREMLWQETLDELNFAGAATIVSQFGKSSTAA